MHARLLSVWLNRMAPWWSPPVFEGNLTKTRQASLIYMIAMTCLVFILIVMVGALRDHTVPATTIVLDLVAMAIIVQFLRWVRSGRVLLARVSMVSFGLVYIIGAVGSIGTVRTPTASIFVFWVLMTGLLFGRVGIWVGTLAASASVAALIVAQNAGWLPPAGYAVGVTQWITFTALFAFTSGLTHHIMRGMEAALSLAEREVEERKKAQTSLTDSERRYRTLVEWMPEPLAVHREGRILFANRAALRLFGAGEDANLLGKPILSFVHPDYQQTALEHAMDIEKNGAQLPLLVYKLLRTDGSAMDVEVQSTQIVYDQAFACLTSMHDISHSKAVEASLEDARAQAEKANLDKSRFLASASHDLRQPAHALGMFVGRMADWPLDASERGVLRNMEASVRAMQDMIDGLFDISTLDMEQSHLNPRVFPLQELLDRLAHSVAPTAQAKGLRLRIRPSDAWVRSDPDMLHRVLLNLLSNAVRYTPVGSVMLAARRCQHGTSLRLEVRDSGIGIDAAHHDDIFQEFFQVANPQRDRSKGMGMGLSIVRKACRLLGHPLQVRSEPGRGSLFTVTVPLAPPEQPLAGVPEQELNESLSGMHILLIEDDELGSLALSTLLESWGCIVSRAEDAQSAYALQAQHLVPDIIISDYRLGGSVDGIEAIEQLRSRYGQDLQACLISGDTHETLQQRSRAAGLTLLQKPVRPAKLRNLLRNVRAQASTS